MKTLSLLIATWHRPDLLRQCLRSLAKQPIPPGWSIERIVLGEKKDGAAQVVAEFPKGLFRYAELGRNSVSGKFNRMLKLSSGELIVLADDDDLQHPHRIACAAQAYDEGYDMASSGRLYFCDRGSGNVTLWKRVDGSVALSGTTFSIRRDFLEAAGGWPPCKRGKDGRLLRRLKMEKPDLKWKDLGALCAPVCFQHDGSLNRHKPVLDQGSSGQYGDYFLVGMGHYKNLRKDAAAAWSLPFIEAVMS